MAAAMDIELLTEQQYRELQKLGHFDTKSSSWVKTPSEIRKLGGALFCDRRYDTVFVYHNGAESYYDSWIVITACLQNLTSSVLYQNFPLEILSPISLFGIFNSI